VHQRRRRLDEGDDVRTRDRWTRSSPSPGWERERVRGIQLTLRRLISVALALLAFDGPAHADPRPSAGCKLTDIERGGRLEPSIDVGGQRRAYILDVPASAKTATPVPLIFDFHGFGHSAAGLWQVSGFRPLAEKEGFITVYPQGLPVKLRLHGKDLTNDG